MPHHPLKSALRRLANKFGYDIVGFDGSNPRARLARTIDRLGICTVLDVGANKGDFGQFLRELGYRGEIVSFEPLPTAFHALSKLAIRDGKWKALSLGLSDSDEKLPLNVAANSQSSSFLPMLDTHLQAAPESRYQDVIDVDVRRLDHIVDEHFEGKPPFFLKIDTQGYERRVLEGARGILQKTPLVQLECSLVPLYQDDELIEAAVDAMRALRYDPIDIQPTFFHRDKGQMMQVDILFERCRG